jgi:type IV pilus assembly protein PilC
MLESGLTLAQAMKQQAKRGPVAVRPVAGRIAEQLDQGHDLQTALQAEADHFPPLFLALSAVAEDSGKLPEVFHELEEYFSLQRQMWRQFLSMIAWPVFQFVAAVGILTFLIWILGVIADTVGESHVNVFGLKGGRDAILFVGSIVGFFAILYGLYWLTVNVLQNGPAIHRFLLRIPGVGGCLRALAVSRFSLGLHMTMETGAPIAQALDLSLNATGNPAFAATSGPVKSSVRKGDDLTSALSTADVFPPEYLAIVETAEVSGQVPEVMRRQARFYHEEAIHKLKWLTRVAGGVVWALIAIVLIAAIIKMYLTIYAPVFQMLE